MQQGGRFGGARFAQFKLVLLGKLVECQIIEVSYTDRYPGESAVGKSSLVLRFVKVRLAL